MKSVIIALFLLALLAVAGLYILAYLSKSQGPAGLVGGRLAPCPETPNCVCSEYAEDSGHYIEALPLGHADPARALDDLEAAIRAAGGEVQLRRDNYLAATFTSRIFRFVDDLEARVDPQGGRIHLRSASRVGKSDLGANRERVARIADFTAFRAR